MSRIKLKALAIGVGIGGLMAGVGYAAIPSSNGSITACKDNKGTLKVIDAEAGQTCSGSQLLLQWNQQGPIGPAGPQGPPGPQGAPGISGYTGASSQSVTDSSGYKLVSAACPPGTRILGGGGYMHTDMGTLTHGIAIIGSYAFAGAWYVAAQEMVPTDVNWRVTSQVICADVSSS